MATEDLKVGHLVVVSSNAQGTNSLIYGSESFSPGREILLKVDEYLIGVLAEYVTSRPRGGPFWKILTPCGVAHIWDSDIGEDDLSIRELSESIGQWLTENCAYNPLEGKYKLKKGLLSIGLFTTSVARTP